MSWQRVESDISLNDPESRFHFRSAGDDVDVIYRDWQNRSITIRFVEVSHFSYGYLAPDAGCAEGDFYCSDDSERIEQLRESMMLGPEQPAFHYLIGNNEDEWCEIVAASHTITVDG